MYKNYRGYIFLNLDFVSHVEILQMIQNKQLSNNKETKIKRFIIVLNAMCAYNNHIFIAKL